MRLFHLLKSRLIQLVFTSTLFLSLYSLWQQRDKTQAPSAVVEIQSRPRTNNGNLIWGVATKMFVISLERRQDRRNELNQLLEAHGLVTMNYPTDSLFGHGSETAKPSVLYINATDSDDPVVPRILAHVRWQRRKEQQEQIQRTLDPTGKGRRTRHSFTEALDKSILGPWGSDFWVQQPNDPISRYEWDIESESYLPKEDILDPDSDHPVFAERGNPFNPHKLFGVELETNNTNLGERWIGLNTTGMGILRPTSLINLNPLTRGVIGCWHSHTTIIRRLAMEGFRESEESLGERNRTYIILEDDVDFEWDIESRLATLWPALPSDWELVMLGHCWSNESRHAPIKTMTIRPSDDHAIFYRSSSRRTYTTSLHPSSSPLCTHAYAVSLRGAIHLSQLLRHPSFAYSRPLDQAFAWLIRNGVVKGAFSIVPSVVVQTKEGKSDIAQKGAGSRWRDQLMDGTKRRIQSMKQRKTGAG